jgi:hypothetical protein
VKIEITVAQDVPLPLKQTLARCGFAVEPCGSGFRLRVGQTWLGFDQVIVRILPRDSSPKGDD